MSEGSVAVVIERAEKDVEKAEIISSRNSKFPLVFDIRKAIRIILLIPNWIGDVGFCYIKSWYCEIHDWTISYILTHTILRIPVVIAHCWLWMEQFSIAFPFLLQTILYWIPFDVADTSLQNTIWWNDSWNNNNDCLFIPFQWHWWFLIVGFSYIESWYWLHLNNYIDAYSFVDANDNYLCQIEIFW